MVYLMTSELFWRYKLEINVSGSSDHNLHFFRRRASGTTISIKANIELATLSYFSGEEEANGSDTHCGQETRNPQMRIDWLYHRRLRVDSNHCDYHN